MLQCKTAVDVHLTRKRCTIFSLNIQAQADKPDKKCKHFNDIHVITI